MLAASSCVPRFALARREVRDLRRTDVDDAGVLIGAADHVEVVRQRRMVRCPCSSSRAPPTAISELMYGAFAEPTISA